jgi:hypothetical protein
MAMRISEGGGRKNGGNPRVSYFILIAIPKQAFRIAECVRLPDALPQAEIPVAKFRFANCVRLSDKFAYSGIPEFRFIEALGKWLFNGEILENPPIPNYRLFPFCGTKRVPA